MARIRATRRHKQRAIRLHRTCNLHLKRKWAIARRLVESFCYTVKRLWCPWEKKHDVNSFYSQNEFYFREQPSERSRCLFWQMELVAFHPRFVYMTHSRSEKYGGLGHIKLFRSKCRFDSRMFELRGCCCRNVHVVDDICGICARERAHFTGHTKKSAKRMDDELLCFEFGVIKLDGSFHVCVVDYDLDYAWFVAIR